MNLLYSVICVILKDICIGYLIYFGYKNKEIEKKGDTSLLYSIISWILLFFSIFFILALK